MIPVGAIGKARRWRIVAILHVDAGTGLRRTEVPWPSRRTSSERCWRCRPSPTA